MISFIVCTKNRCEAIGPALESIAAQGLGELVVVDNGSTDGTSEIVKEWAKSAPMPVQIVVEPRPGLSAARNRALVCARYDILVFTDDDCRLSQSYSSDLLRHYGADRSPIIRGGRVELGDPADAAFTIKTEDARARLHSGINPGGFINGCNMTMTRSAAALVGRFDERFGAGAPLSAAEDTDYVFRAYRAGIPIEYVPDMTVFHFHGRRHPEDIRNLHHGYHIGNGALYLKHRDRELLRFLYWDARNALKELWGCPPFNRELSLSHRSILKANLVGMARYLRCRSDFSRPEA